MQRRHQISAQAHGQLIHHPAAKTESHRAQFAGGIGTRFEPLGRRDEIFGHLLSVHRAKGGSAFLITAGIAADRSQSIGRKGDEIGEREATRYVLDIGIESAVLVNDEHDGQVFPFCRTHQIPFDRAVAGRGLHDFVAHFYAFVTLGTCCAQA